MERVPTCFPEIINNSLRIFVYFGSPARSPHTVTRQLMFVLQSKDDDYTYGPLTLSRFCLPSFSFTSRKLAVS
jgi:hypothetical protein